MEHAGPSEAAGRGSLHVVDQVSLATAHSGERAARALPAGEWRPERLPKQPGTLIGREWEQQAIRHSLLQQDVRLLTVWGPAGVGKTCLALAVASQLEVQAAFADGVVFVDLSVIDEPALVLPTLAEALGVGATPHRLMMDQVQARLRERRLLLVLDNVEHVLEAAPQLAPLLVNCPSLKILATSRAALRLRWERAFPLAPLATPREQMLPNDAQTAASYAAVAMFVERARAARPDFSLTDANSRAVAELCARLDGLPLAIELAASRSHSLPLLVLVARLDHPLALLEAGAPDLPPRQQTLRAAITWSYDLLSADQQLLFGRISAFVGGCSPEAAEAVCAGAGLSGDVLEGLASLIEMSLLRLDEPAAAGTRYSMLPTIRDYALEQLLHSGEAETTRRRHADCYLALAETIEPQLWGLQQREGLDRLKLEHGNLRAALSWAIDQRQAEHGLRLASALWRFWSSRGHLGEGRRWLAELLAMPTSDSSPASAGLRARGLAVAGSLALAQGDDVEAASLHQAGVALSRQTNDQPGLAASLLGLGRVALARGDGSTARTCFEQTLSLALDEPRLSAAALAQLGWLDIQRGDLAAARVEFDTSLALRRQAGDVRGIGLALCGLACLRLERAELTQARAALEEALELVQALGDSRTLATIFGAFSCLTEREGAAEPALQLGALAETLHQTVGSVLPAAQQARLETHLAAAAAQLGAEAAAAARATGRRLSLEQAIVMCRQHQHQSSPPDLPSFPETVVVNGYLEGFTRRERQVVELAVRGYSNRDIATELVISERTAEGHIHSILRKLQLDSRAQLAAWSVRHGLLPVEPER